MEQCVIPAYQIIIVKKCKLPASECWGHRWKSWIQQWSRYATASGLHGKTDKVQVSSLMSNIGPDVIDIFVHLNFMTLKVII